MQYLTSLIAVIAVWIAYQQFQTAREKLKLDLYEKRFCVFETVLGFVSLLALHQKPEAEDVIRLDRAKLTSLFLFGPEVPEYIQSVRDKAQTLTQLDGRRNEIVQLGGGDLLTETKRSQDELLSWFDKQREECRRLFGKYLAINA